MCDVIYEWSLIDNNNFVYNKMQKRCLRGCFGGGPSVNLTASSNTCFSPSWVKAEHSRYLAAPMDLAIATPCEWIKIFRLCTNHPQKCTVFFTINLFFKHVFLMVARLALNQFQGCCKDWSWNWAIVLIKFVNKEWFGYYVIQDSNNKNILFKAGHKKPCSPILTSLLSPWFEIIWWSYS